MSNPFMEDFEKGKPRKDHATNRSTFNSNPFDDDYEGYCNSPSNPLKDYSLQDSEKRGKSLASFAKISAPVQPSTSSQLELTPITKRALHMGYRHTFILEYLLQNPIVAMEDLAEGLSNRLQKLENPRVVWHFPMTARVVSWLPNAVDETTGDLCTCYLINVSLTKSNDSWQIMKRYREFRELNSQIEKVVPKHLMRTIDCRFVDDRMTYWLASSTDTKVRDARMAMLTKWLDNLLKSQKIMTLIGGFEKVTAFFEGQDRLNAIPVNVLLQWN